MYVVHLYGVYIPPSFNSVYLAWEYTAVTKVEQVTEVNKNSHKKVPGSQMTS